MFDFKDFLAFMAIDDAMEEHNPSKKRSTGSTDNKVTTGCIVVCAFTVFAIGLAIVFESWLCFIIITVVGFIIGLNHDVYKFMEEKDDKENVES